MGEAIVEGRTRFCLQHIPHFGLAVLVFVLQGVGVRGVHLNGQVLLGVDELCQNGELLELYAVGAKAAGVRVNVLLQSRAVRQVAGAVRVAGEHPRLTQGVHLALDAVLGTQFFAAPEVVLAAWFQLNRFHLAYLQYA